MISVKHLSGRAMSLLASILLVAFIVTTLQAFAQDTTHLQDMLKNPWILFGFMIFGSVISMAKQWGQAKMDGSAVTVATYLSHVQEILTTLGTNTLAFFLLVDSGNLNYVSAVSIGYALNSISDLNPLGGRSTTLK